MTHSAEQLLSHMSDKGYAVFTKQYDLNIIGVRNPLQFSQELPDAFICSIHVVFTGTDGTRQHFSAPCTTVAGKYYLKAPLNKNGTAMVVPGQHRGVYKIGKHRGYPALVQSKMIPVYRDNDKDTTLEVPPDKRIWTNAGGVNIHRASQRGNTAKVGRWSAGCQVLKNSADLDVLIACANGQVKNGLANSFSYTLIDAEDIC